MNRIYLLNSGEKKVPCSMNQVSTADVATQGVFCKAVTQQSSSQLCYTFFIHNFVPFFVEFFPPLYIMTFLLQYVYLFIIGCSLQQRTLAALHYTGTESRRYFPSHVIKKVKNICLYTVQHHPCRGSVATEKLQDSQAIACGHRKRYQVALR